MGFGINTSGLGKSDSSEESAFRARLVNFWDSRNLDLSKLLLWDPIFGRFVSKHGAAHLFARAHGQFTMNIIFKTTDPTGLLSAVNGSILCQETEALFDKGFPTIVPRFPADPTDEDILGMGQIES